MSACGHEKGLMSIDEAIQSILNTTKTLSTETVFVQNSLSRYLSEPIYSPVNLPSFDQSAVDGYALCTYHLDAKNQFYTLIGEVRAGVASDLILQEGQAIRIFTGGKLPQGTTTIARQEMVEIVSTTQIRITEQLSAHTDIRRCGEELAEGQLLAEANQFVNIGSLAALSMAGVQSLNVYCQPKVAVVITGDEIALDQNSLSDAHVFDANGPLLNAWFKQNAIQAKIIHVSDQAEAVTALFDQLKTEYDVIISTGGVSVGDYDFVRPSSFEVGFEQVFWKVKQKPGKPLYFAQYQHTEHTCYLLGLPGNPAAVYVCMQIYGKLLIDALQGKQPNPEAWFTAKLTHSLKEDKRERFIRMQVSIEQGQLKVSSLANQQSHMLSNLMHANCLVRIPAEIKPEANMLVSGIFI